jgi:acetyl-CoA C-acetyltransferase
MRDVAIIGVGMTPVGEHWGSSLRQIGAEAIHQALEDTDVQQVDALYVGNAYGASFSSQSHVGALLADYAGLHGIEAFSVDAGDASGGAALRTGYLAVASGAADVVIVAGVEKSTDAIAGARVEARNVSLDADYESIHGVTLPAQAALLMRRYMFDYGLDLSAFEGFSINAHANGKRNPLAMYRNTIRQGAFSKAPMVADPVSLFDGAPDADGAAAVILTSVERAVDMSEKPIVIAGSAVSTDTFALQSRDDMLFLNAVALSVQKAMSQANITPDDVNLFEVHDAYTILSALTLEAAGFAERGQGWRLADETIALNGRLPISTFGGLKSRGNPVGATGIYQAVEAALQLRGEAGENQIATPASVALIQSLAGVGNTAITHVLRGFESYQNTFR